MRCVELRHVGVGAARGARTPLSPCTHSRLRTQWKGAISNEANRGTLLKSYDIPLGLSVLGKAGYAYIPGSHARSNAGAVYFRGRWVYFSMVLNWDAPEGDDAADRQSILRCNSQVDALSQTHLRDC